MHQNHYIFFARSTTNETSYRVKPRSSTPISRPPSYHTFSQPMSPKSPVNIVQYHKRRQRGHSPIEVDCGFPPMVSRLRTWQDRNFGSLDFEVGLQEDAMSNTILSSISGGRSVGRPGLWGEGRGDGRKLILKQSLGRRMKMDLNFRWGQGGQSFPSASDDSASLCVLLHRRVEAFGPTVVIADRHSHLSHR